MLAALPMTALNAFGVGFTGGGWQFMATASEVLASIALFPFVCALLVSRSKWIPRATAWLAAGSLMLSAICWIADLNGLGEFWPALDAFGTTGVLAGAAYCVLAEKDKGASTKSTA